MLHIDLKFINMISHKFDRFKRKDDYLFNLRCPVCGDSATKKNKARGYIYRKENAMFYKCHNCGFGSTLGGLLKTTDMLLYNQYVLERYSSGAGGRKSDKDPDFTFEQPKFKTTDRLIDQVLDRLDKLPEDNISVKYCIERGIPKEQFSRLYHIDDISTISQLAPKYKDRIKSKEPRLVLPFLDMDGKLTALTLRALDGNELRYILVKINEEAPTIFGLDCISITDTVNIVEGPIDSLFLPNCIACAGTSFNKISSLNLPKRRIIIDNQPYNKEVCRTLSSYIEAGEDVVIWPENVKEKDINDMKRANLDVGEIINYNTFNRLEAQLRFNKWKKI